MASWEIPDENGAFCENHKTKCRMFYGILYLHVLHHRLPNKIRGIVLQSKGDHGNPPSASVGRMS